MKTLEDIKQLLSKAGFKDFEGSNVDFFIKNHLPHNNHEGQHEYFFSELYLMLHTAINIGRKHIVDNF